MKVSLSNPWKIMKGVLSTIAKSRWGVVHPWIIMKGVLSTLAKIMKGVLSTLEKSWRGVCPALKNHEGGFVHPWKIMKGILSTIAKSRWGFCPPLQSLEMDSVYLCKFKRRGLYFIFFLSVYHYHQLSPRTSNLPVFFILFNIKMYYTQPLVLKVYVFMSFYIKICFYSRI